MDDAQLKIIVSEIKAEQQISPFFDDNILIQLVKEAEFNINEQVGEAIKYEDDLQARSLLKNHVLYANHKRLAEFKQLYGGEYVELQIKYNRDTNVS